MSTASVEEIIVARASYAQRRLWLLSQLEPDNSSMHICAAVELRGALDVGRLQNALQQVVERHEALRTTFTQENGEPMQVIARNLIIPLPVDEVNEHDIEAIARREFDTPFSLLNGPLVRVRLLRLSPDRHVLLSVLHHIIADGWSMGRLVDEMTRLYRGEKLEPLALQYADFAEWQQEYLSGQRLQELLDYWTEQLQGSREGAKLPTDRQRPPVRTFKAGAVSFTLDQQLARALKNIGAECGATLFMTLLTSFGVLLSRYSGETDLTIGTPVANRQRRELEPLIGMFVNSLALRIDLSGNPTFRELLGRVRETSFAAYDHQDLPFERVVEALQPGRSTSHTPLFQIMFALQNAPQTDPSFAGLELHPLPWGKSRTLFDLTMILEERADGIGGSVEFSQELFDEETISALCRRFEHSLRLFVQQPDCRLANISLLDSHDRAQVECWSRTSHTPAEQTIHALFEAQARATPDAIALIEENRALTYRELDACADQIAQKLMQQGVRPDTPVAVSMDRSRDLIATILGILKAGAAYLCLERSWPSERIESLIRHSGAVRLTEVDGSPKSRVSLPHVTPDHLAYISYTSGSTGVPKGVSVPHRAVARLAKNADYIRVDHNETVLCFAPVSFDASTLEIWGALLNGARLVLAPPQASLAELARCIRTHKITTCWLSAGLFQAMTEEHLTDLALIRQLVAGGDVLSPAHVARFLEAAPGSTLINGYGPTENTTFTCCHRITGPIDTGAIPIGRPIPNTSVYIVDQNFQLTPPGVPGELLTGGDGLARGYYRQSALTAGSFVPNPFDPAPGSRLYRTGDLARWRVDGTVEFLGRLDQQVKIRGFRIEPGEVEAVLTALAGIKAAAVSVRGEGSQKRLVAWVVPKPGATLDSDSVRALLKARLADYLTPSAIHFVSDLPLNANGKVDRGALQEPAASPNEPNRPETATQSRLAELWSGLLPGMRIGPDSEFFSSGGHSLLASQLVSRIRREFNVGFSLRQIFDAPVLRRQAALIDEAEKESALAVRPVERGDKIPLTPAQHRLWLLQQMDPQSTAYNIPIALRLCGILDRPALERSLQAIIDRHEILRTAFFLHEGEPVQAVLPSLQLVVSYTSVSHEEVARHIEENAAYVFDLARPPQLRVQVLRLSAEEHILLTSMHHIICDGWSVGLFVAEWKALYSEFTGHAPSGLKPLVVQYADYAMWERRRVDSDPLRGQLDYWVRRLEHVPPFVNLPVDRPRSANPAQRGALWRFDVPTSLLALGDRAGTTPFMTALAAFGVLLSRYAGQERVSVASAVANRHREEIEPLIGCFVNTLPLTVDTSANPSFLELLARVRSMCLGAYAHQETPFEQIVEAARAAGATGSAPFGQIGFASQTFSMPSLDLPGLRLELIDSEIRSAKAEMTLILNSGENGLQGIIEYNIDLFDSETIRSVAADFARLLQTVANEPELRLAGILEKSQIGDMPLASAPESRSNLTRSQLLTWLGQRLRQDDPLYNIGIYFAVPLAIDATVFRAALETVVRSSDALRTVFVEEEGVPMQVVQSEMAAPLELLDFSGQPDPNACMHAWGEARIKKPYNLAQCCIDFALAKLSSASYAWYIGLHHLVGDGLAIALLFRRVSEVYEQALAGRLPRTVSLPSYRDAVAAERRVRFTRQYRAAKEFWEKQLERPAEPIPFYGQLARHQSPRVESVVFNLGVDRSQRVRERAASSFASTQAERRALYDFFGAILCSLMHRISGASEIPVGISFHNRPSREAKETIGHFMSVVPIRVPVVAETDTIQAIAARFASLTFQAFRRSAYVVSNPPNRRNYEIFYNYQINTFPSFAGAHAETTRVFTRLEEDTFALHITDYGESGNIGVQMDFSHSDFTDHQRRQTVNLFHRLIDSYLESPETSIETLPLLTASERIEQLAPAPRVVYPAASAIHHLFEQQVARNREAEALVDGDRRYSFGELHEASERLAVRLQMQGVAPEVRVGVLLQRGAAQIVALLSVLRAGGVYVPIDADLPLDRIHYILTDCGARIVVTSSNLPVSLIPNPIKPVFLDRDEDAAGVLRQPALAGANLAYAIYTSGSTGRPKGVMVTHSALLNAFHGWRDAYNLDTVRRHLQMANFSFDVFTGDWVRALCSGSTLILCPREWLLSPGKLYELIVRESVECAEFVPGVAALLAVFCKTGGHRLDTMKVCIAGSDIWTASEYRDMRSICGPKTRVINSYGLTEAAIDSSYYEDVGDLTADSAVPIGKPFANTRLLILDRRMEPVPTGVPGELYIGGDGLARGYSGKPGLTAERFVPDPSNHAPGARLYRTGDRARLLPSGDVEFLGRQDNQVKVRGYRVELSEIEAAMLAHPGVHKAVAVVRASCLVAYIEPDAANFDVTGLKTALLSRLPEYMVPAQYVPLSKMPLTPSGKIDRRALPAVSVEEARESYAAPRNETEARLAAIWVEVLRVRKVGIYNNFFEAGGHSLLATQIISRVNEGFGVSLPLRSLFDGPTIAQQAVQITGQNREEGEL